MKTDARDNVDSACKRDARFHLFSGWSSKEFSAEIFGTFIMMVIGNSMSAVMTLKKSQNVTAGGYISGIGAMIGIMTTLPISGGHINPGVTVAFACTGRLAWNKVPHYVIGQYIGSFAAQIIVYAMFAENIHAFDGGVRSAFGGNTSTGQIFVTLPNPSVSLVTCVLCELIATCLLLLGVCAIIDQKGCKVPSFLQPFLIAGWICAVGTSLGLNTSGVLNPARDLAPRIFMALVGYGMDAFQPLQGHYWYSVGVFAPHLGALIGVILYDTVISTHLNEEHEGEDDIVNSSRPISTNDREPLVEHIEFTIFSASA